MAPAGTPTGVITQVDDPAASAPHSPRARARPRPRGPLSPTSSGSLGYLRRVFSPSVVPPKSPAPAGARGAGADDDDLGYDDDEDDDDENAAAAAIHSAEAGDGTATGAHAHDQRPARRRFFAQFCACFAPERPPVEYPPPANDVQAQLSQIVPTLVPESPLLAEPAPDLADKPCLVLDLDETLVHSSFTPIDSPDYEIPLEMNGETHICFVKKRPGVDKFLAAVSEHYEVVVFTASLSLYADPVMELLDPDHRVHARLYREHCVFVGGCYVKDISKLGRNLMRTLIIDNSHLSYAFQPENAIPIESFFDDENDRELEGLLPLLDRAHTLADVRNVYTQSG